MKAAIVLKARRDPDAEYLLLTSKAYPNEFLLAFDPNDTIAPFFMASTGWVGPKYLAVNLCVKGFFYER